ncbi:S8 family serine peptidase [Streptomyces sp. JV185]|uniref:S8 family serine peptidase n=1 Tax=Streptomyces sp. JV185 TaxID=858638 RepID=UPI002E78F7DE|nr:S8 family serine peptidase [Streptomyces sp. JV185]MEE1772250.1 S8 family serine peptidase [Streptomyces sp. JV185]
MAMKSQRPRHAALAAVVLAGTLAAAPGVADASAHDPSQRVLVELSRNPAVTAAPGGSLLSAGAARDVGAARRAIDARQETFLGSARRAGLHPSATRRLGLLVDAVAMTVPASEVGRLSALPGVTAVRPDTRVLTKTDASVPLIGAPGVWQRKDPAGSRVNGRGTTVAILDSGVDYTHPDLGGGLGKGHKVVGGHDFVNGDNDPMDDNGHGTHVAGIVAGRAAKKGGVTGVAPGADLLAYKVMDADGSGYTSDIIAGMEAASDPANPHRADVINMSLGGPGDGTDPLGRAATAAVRAGVVVVAAAGNDGPGKGTVSSPGTADGVLSVGASTSNLRLPSAYLAGRKPELIQSYRGVLSANPPKDPVTAPLVDVGEGTPEDWKRVGDVRGKIVRGQMLVASDAQYLTADAVEWAREAEKRGAIAVLAGLPSNDGPVLATGAPDGIRPPEVNPEPGVTEVPSSPARLDASGDSLRMDRLVVMGIDSTQYQELSSRLAAGKVSVTVRGTDTTDRIASFSSRGPTQGFGLKPDLVAPGVEIRSTVPKSLYGPGQYRMSGTSMAAPHVAGAAALLRQLHPGRTPAEIKAELIGTAKPLSGTGATTRGAGRLDVAAAASATVSASPASVSFGLADLSGRQVGGTAKVKLRNPGKRPVTASLRTDGPAKVWPRRVTVPAGRTATVTVSLRVARPAADTEIDGRLTATPDRGPSITVPYLLAVRHLAVQAAPDPSDGHSTVHIAPPTRLAAPPAVTVTPPHGKPVELTSALDPATGYYRAQVTGSVAGAYRVSVRGTAATGQLLTGASAFEVTPVDSRGDRWEPVGPNSEAGSVALSPSRPKQAVLTQYQKAAPWLTTDNGASWRQLGRLPVADGTGPLVVDAGNPDRWWYAVNRVHDGSRRGAVLRTDDNGRTWRTLEFPDTRIAALVADERTRTLVAVTSDALLVSTDAGDHWTTYPTGVTGAVTAAAVTGDTLYLTTYHGLWARSGIGSGDPGEARLLFDPADESVGSMAADASVVAVYVPGRGVVGSHDGGKTWTTLLPMTEGGLRLFVSGDDLYLSTLSGNGRLSRDHGKTWTEVPAPSRAALPVDYDRWADGSVTVSSEQDGLYRGAADGTGYRRIGVQGLTVNDLAVSDGRLLAATDSAVYRTALPVAGPEWGQSGGEGGRGVGVPQLAVSAKDSKVVWKVRRTGFGAFTVERSGDGGKTWEKRGSSAEVPTALLVHPADPNRVMVSFRSLLGEGLFATGDGGATWKNLYHDRYFSAIVGDPADPRRLWLGNTAGLYRSDDGGVTVTKVADGPVTAIDLDGRRLVVGGESIRVSTDGGRTFRTSDTGAPAIHVSDLLRVGDTYYAATTSSGASGLLQGGRGVLRSTDRGRSWQNISTGLQNTDTTRLAADPDGGALYVGTVDGGVHRLDLRH